MKEHFSNLSVRVDATITKALHPGEFHSGVNGTPMLPDNRTLSRSRIKKTSAGVGVILALSPLSTTGCTPGNTSTSETTTFYINEPSGTATEAPTQDTTTTSRPRTVRVTTAPTNTRLSSPTRETRTQSTETSAPEVVKGLEQAITDVIGCVKSPPVGEGVKDYRHQDTHVLLVNNNGTYYINGVDRSDGVQYRFYACTIPEEQTADNQGVISFGTYQGSMRDIYDNRTFIIESFSYDTKTRTLTHRGRNNDGTTFVESWAPNPQPGQQQLTPALTRRIAQQMQNGVHAARSNAAILNATAERLN